jgi:hypothetical protein
MINDHGSDLQDQPYGSDAHGSADADSNIDILALVPSEVVVGQASLTSGALRVDDSGRGAGLSIRTRCNADRPRRAAPSCRLNSGGGRQPIVRIFSGPILRISRVWSRPPYQG